MKAPLKTFEAFTELEIPQTLKSSLQNMGFLQPTPIQRDAIPAALLNKDIVGTAQTGTGKTGAFAIPLLSALYNRPGKLALILAPTRELASQIQKVMRLMAKDSQLKGSLVVGGESFSRQANELDRGVDYIVATPGRLNDHLGEGTVHLDQVEILVLDEVDRMLDMGFLPQIRSVLQHVPKQRQTLLFSATLPPEIARFVDTLVKNPVRVSVGDATKPNSQVKETIRRVQGGEKPQALLEELRAREGKVLVFVRTKARTHRLLRSLDREGFKVVCLHGGRTQGQRKRALEVFRMQPNSILVATDLAGRGLDITDVDHVINFDVPQSREDYIHRIGRTGRRDREGEAVSFVEVGNKEEEKIVGAKSNINNTSNINIPPHKHAPRPQRPDGPSRHASHKRPSKQKFGARPERKSGERTARPRREGGGWQRDDQRPHAKKVGGPSQRGSRSERSERHVPARSHSPSRPRRDDEGWPRRGGEDRQDRPQGRHSFGNKPRGAGRPAARPNSGFRPRSRYSDRISDF